MSRSYCGVRTHTRNVNHGELEECRALLRRAVGSNTPGKNAQDLLALQASGFTTAILWTLHVDSDGSLVYNDTVIVRDGIFAATFNYLPELVTQLTAAVSSVQTVLCCIGSADAMDFTHVRTLLATSEGRLTLIRNFSALSTALPIHGYDFDDEDLCQAPTLAALSEILCSSGRMIITYCPYTRQDIWNQAISEVYAWAQNQTPRLEQPVRWWNLQCYAGGTGNDPAAWAQMLSSDAGIAAPAAYIVPGYAANGRTPLSIEQTFRKLATNDPGINGGFIWNSSAITAAGYAPRDYAQAIITGLDSGSAARDKPDPK